MSPEIRDMQVPSGADSVLVNFDLIPLRDCIGMASLGLVKCFPVRATLACQGGCNSISHDAQQKVLFGENDPFLTGLQVGSWCCDTHLAPVPVAVGGGRGWKLE